MLFLPRRGGPIPYQGPPLRGLVVETPCTQQKSSIDPSARFNQFVWVILAVWNSLTTIPLVPATLYVLAVPRRLWSPVIHSGFDESRFGNANHFFALCFLCRAFPPRLAIRRRSAAESFLLRALPALLAMRVRSLEDRLRARCFPPNLPRLTAFGFFLAISARTNLNRCCAF